MKAYKLLRERKNGTLGSLFVNKRAIIPVNKWIAAEEHKTKGLKFRPGWHTTIEPVAPHLSMKDRVWYEVEIKDFYELNRPALQGEKWFIAKKMKVVRRLND